MLNAYAALNPPPHTLTFFEIFQSASPVVMLVLLLLVGFSIVSWAILISKWRTVRLAMQESDGFIEVFWSGKSMDQIYTESKRLAFAPVAKLFKAGYLELQKLMDRESQKKKDPSDKSSWTVPPESSISNLERALSRAHRNESLRLERSLTFLATTGSTAPFIGLFGTVWGIMNAFQNIGREGGASLAVVAPGIAEALIATAIGLACAIPAVMGYNYYSYKIRALRTQMDNFAGDFLNIIRRNFLAG